MNKVFGLLLAFIFTASSYALAEDSGTAAGSAASTLAQGNANAKGVALVATITAIALLTAGGGDGATVSTTTTTVAAK